MSNKFEQPPQNQKQEKEQREISPEEVEKMGEEMEEYYLSLQKEAKEIKKELANMETGEERRAELKSNLELILEQLEEGDWEGFVDDIKAGEYSYPVIKK